MSGELSGLLRSSLAPLDSNQGKYLGRNEALFAKRILVGCP